VGTADFDGDGRQEIVVAGINNRMGWAAGIGVLGGSDEGMARKSYFTASTPDAERAGWTSSEFRWYAILPPNVDVMHHTRIDPVRRTVSVDYVDGRKYVLDASGFLAGSRAGAPGVDRQGERRAAYAEMLHAMTAIEGSNSGTRTLSGTLRRVRAR
jgi:hypothetical protein